MQARSIALSFYSAFRRFHAIESQNARDWIVSDRQSKPAWLYCVLRFPFVLSESAKERWLRICRACVMATWRWGLRAPLVTRSKILFLVRFSDRNVDYHFCNLTPKQQNAQTAKWDVMEENASVWRSFATVTPTARTAGMRSRTIVVSLTLHSSCSYNL